MSITKHLNKKFYYLILGLISAAMLGILVLNARIFYDMTGEQADAIGRTQLEMVSNELEATLYEAEILTRKVSSDIGTILSDQGMGTELKDEISKNSELYDTGKLPDNSGKPENSEDSETNETDGNTNGNAYRNTRNTLNIKIRECLTGWKRDPGNESCINVYAASRHWYIIPDFKEPRNFNPAERDWYKGARKKGVDNIYITAPYKDLATGVMCFTSSLLLSDGETVVALDFDLKELQESVSRISIAGGDSLIVSRNGQIVGYTDPSAVGGNLSESLPQYTSAFRKILSSGEDSLYFRTNISGKESTVFYSCTANEWYLLSIVSNTALYRKNVTGIIFTSILNFCLILCLVFLFVSSVRYRTRVEKRLSEAEASVKKVLEEINAPMEDIAMHSDYELLKESEDPVEHMNIIRESSLKIRDAVYRLSDFGFKAQEGAVRALIKKGKRVLKDQGTDVSDKTNRFATTGIILLLSLTMVLCIVLSTNIMMRWGNTRMEREAGAYSEELDLWITEQKSVLDMFVSYISANPEILLDYEKCVKWLNDITTQYKDISVTYMTNPEAEHTVIMNNGWEPDDDWHVEERQWYIDSLEEERNDGFSISAPYYDEQIGAYCVTFSKRVYDRIGNFLGIFGVDFFLDKLTQILDNSYTDEGYAFLVDADGKIINHPNNSYQMSESNVVSIDKAGYINAIFSDSTTLIRDYDGKYRAFYSVTDFLSGFSIVCAKNWEVIYGSLVWYDIIFVLIFGIAIAIAGFLLHMMMVWQRRAKEVLQESVDAAKRADRAKSQFLAQMSHEIRTPINSVLGMNEMIMRESKDRGILEYSDSIREAGRTLLSLINSILDFSKIEDGKMEIVPVDYDVASMINDLVNMVWERAEKKGLELKLEIDESIPKTLYGDDVRLRQVITNILTNAVKYTRKGRVVMRIRVSERTEKDLILHVEVEDTGIGIREEDRDAMFESFHRLDMEKNRTIEGTGLGMAIIQKLLIMMGSNLELESTYGKGSNFYFDIKQGIVDPEPIGNYEEHRRQSMERQESGKYIYAPDARVLVIDDNKMNLKVAAGLLKRSGMYMDSVMSGQEGIEALTRAKYDIVLLDHMMPEMDGVETFREIKKRGILPEGTAVIMMTANAIVGARDEYLSDGFDDYLSKPIQVKELEDILKHHLPPEKLHYKDINDKNLNVTSDTKNTGGFEIEEAEAKGKEGIGIRDTKDTDDVKDEVKMEMANKADINIEIGMGYCMDDDELYNEMLQTYVDESDEKEKELANCIKEGNIKNYTVEIHALKSMSKTIGAMGFADKAYELEKAGKEGRFEDIKARHEEVMKEYKLIVNEAAALLKSREH